MRVGGLTAMLILAGAAPAAASAGFWCEGDDENIAFSVEGGLGRSIPGPPFGFKGSMKVKVATAPKEFRDFEFGSESLAQSWFDGDEIQIEVYQERPAGLFAAISLAIKTALDPEDELTFNGTCTLNTEEMPTKDAPEATRVTVSGAATCSAG